MKWPNPTVYLILEFFGFFKIKILNSRAIARMEVYLQWMSSMLN